MRYNNIFKTTGLLIIVTCIFLYSCKKKEEQVPPTISFKIGDNYTKNNAVVAVGRRLYFGIQARGTSDFITNFTIKKVLEDGKIITVKDSGVYTKYLDFERIYYQNVEPTVKWAFAVMDRSRKTSEISLIVLKDPNSAYGGIFYFPSLKLGYQNNTAYGHFLDPTNGKVYFEDSATINKDKIDILTYYISATPPCPVLSSPGEMDNSSVEAKTYYPCIMNWQPRKYTLWDIGVDNVPITTADFDSAQNDSLLIVSYHDIDGKKKFRWASTNRIIPFITSGGKKGLIKVINAETVDNGSIEIALKIQQ